MASYAPIARLDGQVHWAWAALYVASRLPQSLANVRSESILQSGCGAETLHRRRAARSVPSPAPARSATAAGLEGPVNVRVNGDATPPLKTGKQWSQLAMVLRAGLWTAVIGVAFNVPSSLLLATARGHPPRTVLNDYSLGAACLLGVAPPNRTSWTGDLGDARCDGTAARAAAAFALPGALFAVSEFHVLQAASASTYFLLMCCLLYTSPSPRD